MRELATPLLRTEPRAVGRAVGAARVAAPARTAGVLGLGVARPDLAVPNAEVAERIGVDSDWIERRTGIRSRRRLRPGERLSDLAIAAARAALADVARRGREGQVGWHRGATPGGTEGADPDLVIAATFTADELTPGMAPLVAEALGSNAAAVDLNAACTGFLTGLDLGAAAIESGRARRVLLVAAEALSRFTDRDDRRTAGLFGDGAGAVVLGAGEGSLGPVILRSAGEHAPLIVASREDPFIRMEGHETFLVATASLCEATVDAVAAAGIGLDDVDLFVYHQANRRILDAVAERIGLDRDRVVDAIADHGNTSAASIPLALAEAREQGRLASGDRVLIGAVGAGFVYGAGVLTW